MPSGPVRPVRPCLVRPLGLCPAAGVWQLILSGQALLSKAPWSLPHGGPVAAKVWFRLGRGPFWTHLAAIWGHGLLQSSTRGPEPQLHWPGLTPFWAHLGAMWGHGLLLSSTGAPGSNRASVALAWFEPPSGPILAPYGGMVSFYLQPGPLGATEPQLHWPGLTPLLAHLGAIWGHGLLLSSTGAPGSNRASVSLAWVDPPSGPILAPYGGMVSFYLQPGFLKATGPQLHWPGLTPLPLNLRTPRFFSLWKP